MPHPLPEPPSEIQDEIVLPLQAASSVFICASIIGFIDEDARASEPTKMTANGRSSTVDDYGLVTRRQKAALVLFAGIPLVFLRPVASVLELPFVTLDFTHYQLAGFHVTYILFWLIIVPFGVMASANAPDDRLAPLAARPCLGDLRSPAASTWRPATTASNPACRS